MVIFYSITIEDAKTCRKSAGNRCAGPKGVSSMEAGFEKTGVYLQRALSSGDRLPLGGENKKHQMMTLSGITSASTRARRYAGNRDHYKRTEEAILEQCSSRRYRTSRFSATQASRRNGLQSNDRGDETKSRTSLGRCNHRRHRRERDIADRLPQLQIDKCKAGPRPIAARACSCRRMVE